jgi:NTE family protein
MKAFVFAGGASYGAWETGALERELNDHGNPDYIIGTSAGALDGSCFALAGLDKLKSVWMSLNHWSDIWEINRNPNAPGILNSDPLHGLIFDIASNALPTTIAAEVSYCDLQTGFLEYAYFKRPTLFPASTKKDPIYDFIMYVEASAAVPVLVSPIANRYVDGGIRENTPVKRAIDQGATEIVIFNPFRRDLGISHMPPILRKAHVAVRTAMIIQHEMMLCDIHHIYQYNTLNHKNPLTVRIAEPPVSYSQGILDFSRTTITRAIEVGKTCPAKPL